MSVFSKVFTVIINKRLYNWAAKERKIIKSKVFENITPQLITFLLQLP